MPASQPFIPPLSVAADGSPSDDGDPTDPTDEFDQWSVSVELAAGLDAMSAILLDEGTVEAVLSLLVGLARTSLEPVDGASVSVVRTDNLETATATSDEVRDLDQSQYDTGAGPCVQAIRDGLCHNVLLAEEADGWPAFVGAAMAAGFQAVLSTPLSVGGRTVGALNLYSRQDHVFSHADVDAAAVFANRAAVVLANATAYANTEATNHHLQVALEHARIIGRAQGVIMVRQNCDSDAAFDTLRRASQRTNRKLRDIAEEIAGPFDHAAAVSS